LDIHSLIVEPEHYRYLSVQHGSIAQKENLRDFAKWQTAYGNSLRALYETLLPALPKTCDALLDIGSGLGGIDVLLSRHYAGLPRVCLVDGEHDPPEVRWSSHTHSDMDVAKSFLQRNGVEDIGYFTPGRLRPIEGQPKFDLVVSFAAYGFHIHPGNYLEDIRTVIHDRTVLIFDVRRSKEDWLRLLIEGFGKPTVLVRGEKYVRCVFRALRA
jgi:hypothetical protein